MMAPCQNCKKDRHLYSLRILNLSIRISEIHSNLRPVACGILTDAWQIPFEDFVKGTNHEGCAEKI